MSALRVGVIPFLNAKPIVFGLEMGTGKERFALEYHNPHRCAELLFEGRLDLAMIPSIEFAHCPELRIVPGISIAARREVLSVLLLAEAGLDGIGKIAVDSRSRTSVALLRILCAELYHINPELAPMEADAAAMLEQYGAALLIGDEALCCREKTKLRRDLATDWRALTGQPFVFAFFAGREGALQREDVALLHLSLHEGKRNIPKIAANYQAPGIGNGADLYEKYMADYLSYELDETELNGLKLFYIKAWEHRLIKELPHLRFYDA